MDQAIQKAAWNNRAVDPAAIREAALREAVETAEAKLAKAVATLTALADMKTSGDGKGAVAMAWHAREALNKIKGMDK